MLRTSEMSALERDSQTAPRASASGRGPWCDDTDGAAWVAAARSTRCRVINTHVLAARSPGGPKSGGPALHEGSLPGRSPRTAWCLGVLSADAGTVRNLKGETGLMHSHVLGELA